MAVEMGIWRVDGTKLTPVVSSVVGLDVAGPVPACLEQRQQRQHPFRRSGHDIHGSTSRGQKPSAMAVNVPVGNPADPHCLE